MNSYRVALIASPVGLKGECNLKIFTDNPVKRFAVGSKLSTSDQSIKSLTVANYRRHKVRHIIRFEEIDTCEQIESLKGVELFVDDSADYSDDANTEIDEYYYDELIGLTAKFINCDSEFKCGKVLSVLQGVAQSILEIEVNSKKVLIPFVKQIVTDVNIKEQTIIIDPPDGLLDL